MQTPRLAAALVLVAGMMESPTPWMFDPNTADAPSAPNVLAQEDSDRANALEHNACWYYVQNGHRIEVKPVRVPVASSVRHTLRADMRGDHIEVFFNDKKLIDAHDARCSAAGRIGVRTKADSDTPFDDLTATELVP